MSHRALHSLILAALLLPAAPLQAKTPPEPDQATVAAYEGRPADLVPLAAKALLLGASRAGKGLAAAGEHGVVIRSDDGVNWRQLPVPVNKLLTDVFFLDQDIGWVVGHDGLILHTTDGGNNWVFQYYQPSMESPLAFMKILFLDQERGFIAGSGGNLFETRDGGATWQSRVLSTAEDFDAHLYGIERLDDGTLMLAGEIGSIFRSRDDGATWQQLAVDYGGSFFGLLKLADQSILVFGMRSNIYRTVDQGDTWTKIDSDGARESLTSGTQLEDGRIILVGRSGTVLVSTDLGKTFSNQSLRERVGINAVLPFGAGFVLFGDKGVMGLH